MGELFKEILNLKVKKWWLIFLKNKIIKLFFFFYSNLRDFKKFIKISMKSNKNETFN